MAEKLLIVVDVQNDFVTDALGTKEAEIAAQNVIEKVRNFDGKVIYTQDTHAENYMQTQEGHLLPVAHCIKGTKGWELIPELEALGKLNHSPVFEKVTFGSTDLARYLVQRNEKNEIESIELVGLCTDICVISNALLIKACMPELPLYVDASCCAGVTPAKHDAALETMRSCQIHVLNA